MPGCSHVSGSAADASDKNAVPARTGSRKGGEYKSPQPNVNESDAVKKLEHTRIFPVRRIASNRHFAAHLWHNSPCLSTLHPLRRKTHRSNNRIRANQHCHNQPRADRRGGDSRIIRLGFCQLRAESSADGHTTFPARPWWSSSPPKSSAAAVTQKIFPLSFSHQYDRDHRQRDHRQHLIGDAEHRPDRREGIGVDEIRPADDDQRVLTIDAGPPIRAVRISDSPAEYFLQQKPSDARAGVDRRQDKQRLEHDREVIPIFPHRSHRRLPPAR